ncbi:hypothetical protein ScPMuIL_008806 [Solemya velum]
MAGFLSIESREVIRVEVKKCDGLLQPEYKRFSLDPQITSFEILQKTLTRAFGVKSDFTISYLAQDVSGQDVYLSMLSDWDMDAAFQTASDPCLKLKLDLKPFEEGLDDWDIIAPGDVPQYRFAHFIDRNSFLSSLTGTISSHVEKTMSTMQRTLGLKTELEPQYRAAKNPMTDMEFHNYLDSSGHMVKPEEFRISIYQGGIEPALRRVVWRHLLNIFPDNLSGRERFDYMKRKEKEYYKLRDQWREEFSQGTASEEIKYVATMVKKDVLRTDRMHKFYSGADDSRNLISLFHLLVTYSLTHPEVSYCQGMSDIASPLLVIQKDEAQAYLCFCGVMNRLRSNFLIDGEAITTKFNHLGNILQIQDPVFFEYLKEHGAQDLFFCYRWFLLELKREFPFEDALYMLEVMWSTLPPDHPELELPLMDPEYCPSLLSSSPASPTFSIKQTVYAKLLSLRRHKSTISKHSSSSDDSFSHSSSLNNNNSNEQTCCANEYPKMDAPEVQELKEKLSDIDQSLEHSMSEDSSANSSADDFSSEKCNGESDIGSSMTEGHTSNTDMEDQPQFQISLEMDQEERMLEQTQRCSLHNKQISQKSVSTPSKLAGGSVETLSLQKDQKSSDSLSAANSQSMKNSLVPGSVQNTQKNTDTSQKSQDDLHISDCVEVSDDDSLDLIKAKMNTPDLPKPHEFGCGNPFLMFLCLTLLLQHREQIIHNKLDYDEISMLFDRMVRKHNVHKVLHQARLMYSDYLRTQQKLHEQEMMEEFGVSV